MSLLDRYTALYSPEDVMYAQAMSGPYEDLSHRGDDCVVVAGMKDGLITGFWRPMVAVGDPKMLKLHIEALWSESKRIVYLDFLVNGELSVVSQFLLRHKYRAVPQYVQVIDATQSLDVLHSAVRKSYRSLINKAGNLWHGEVEDVHRVHLLCRGQTRSDATWDIQARMEPVCVIDGASAAAMFYVRGDWAYYACGASHDYGHACIWSAIQACKARGVKYIEMGEQIFYGDEKLVNIAKFKRGFGGRTITRLLLQRA